MNFCRLILVLLFTVVLVHCNADTNACSNIIAEDGSEYDLITLVEKGHVSVRLQVGDFANNFTFAICANTVKCGASNYLVGTCAVRTNDGVFGAKPWAFGDFKADQITGLNDGQGVELFYSNSTNSTWDYYTVFRLLCDYNSVGIGNYNTDTQIDGARVGVFVTINTEAACPVSKFIRFGGRTIFLAIVLGIVVLYLVIGMLVSKCLGRQGRQVIPHSDFWCDLPSLVKAGCVYTFCRGRSRGYEVVNHTVY